jgi:hypothetical protein
MILTISLLIFEWQDLHAKAFLLLESFWNGIIVDFPGLRRCKVEEGWNGGDEVTISKTF